jgi:hypothetical protein
MPPDYLMFVRRSLPILCDLPWDKGYSIMVDVSSHTFILTKYYSGMYDGTRVMIALIAKTLNPRILRSDDHSLLFDT